MWAESLIYRQRSTDVGMAHGEELRGVSDMSNPNQLPWDATRLPFCIAASESAMILNESVHVCCWIAFTRWCVILVTVLLSYSVHDNNPKLLIRIKKGTSFFSCLHFPQIWVWWVIQRNVNPTWMTVVVKVTHIRTCCQLSLYWPNSYFPWLMG